MPPPRRDRPADAAAAHAPSFRDSFIERDGQAYRGKYIQKVSAKHSIDEIQAYVQSLQDDDLGITHNPVSEVPYASIQDYVQTLRSACHEKSPFVWPVESMQFQHAITVALHHGTPGNAVVIKNGRPIPGHMQAQQAAGPQMYGSGIRTDSHNVSPIQERPEEPSPDKEQQKKLRRRRRASAFPEGEVVRTPEGYIAGVNVPVPYASTIPRPEVRAEDPDRPTAGPSGGQRPLDPAGSEDSLGGQRPLDPTAREVGNLPTIPEESDRSDAQSTHESLGSYLHHSDQEFQRLRGYFSTFRVPHCGPRRAHRA